MLKGMFGRRPEATADEGRREDSEINDKETVAVSEYNNDSSEVQVNELEGFSTVLGEGCVLAGNIEVSGRLYISGTIEGKVRCDDLVFIGKTGVVTGELLAMDVRVAGYFDGILECGELSIDSAGKVSGEASTDTFVIESGGQFQGESRKRSADNVTQLIRSSKEARTKAPKIQLPG